MTTQITLTRKEQSFLEETSNDLSRGKGLTMDAENADQFARFFDRLAKNSKSAGHPLFVSIANTCRGLCTQINSQTSPEVCQKAAKLVKESLYALHASLYKVVLDGEVQSSRMQFVRILSRVQTLSDEIAQTREVVPKVEPETHSEPQFSLERMKEPPQPLGYLLFRIAGRRYAVTADALDSVGRLGARNWMIKAVKTKEGIIPLKDMKMALGIAGEAGTAYIALKDANGEKRAWAVDGIEGLRRADKLTRKNLDDFGRPKTSPLHGVMTGILKESPMTPPIFLLRSDYLFSVHKRKNPRPRKTT